MHNKDHVDIDSMPSHIKSGTVEYWKYRSRQWQKMCKRSETEKGELIAELNALKAERPVPMRPALLERRERFAAVAMGDVYNGQSTPPRRI